MMFALNAIGIDVRHTGEFVIDRPSGSGDCLLIVFKTPAFLTLGGHETKVSPDSAVIFSKGSRQYYRAAGESYVNHFLHFSGTDDLYGTGGICFDRLLTGGAVSEAGELLRMISREQMSAYPNRDRCISSLICLLLLKLSEQPAEPSFTAESIHSSVLNELRAEMYSNPAQFASVADMAQRANLSPSHFQQLYKTQFSVSSYEDLLTAKLKTAQFYLSSTSLSVKEIAGLCGYANVTCFLHLFKVRTGVTPSGYRRSLGG